jgi:MFS transporter, SP family, sugar:H+ symporter
MSDAAARVAGGQTNKLLYFFGALGGLLFGYDTGVISGAILFIQQELGTTPFLEGLIVSSLLIGAMVGAAGCGPLSDAIGRRKVIVIAAVIFGVGAIGAALTPNAAVLIFFRFVLGLAVGTASLTVPLYLSEMAPTQIRGAISSLNQLMIVTGILVAYLVNASLAAAGAWRWMFGLALIPSLALLAGIFFMPETPRWLVSRDRDEEAREVLRLNRDEATAEHDLKQIMEIEETEEGGLRELLASWVRPMLVVGMGLAIFQQITGINTIVYYAPTTLTNVGYGAAAAIYANVIIGVVMVLMTLVAIRFIDRIGRKPLLLGGLVGMVASLAVLGIFSLLLPQPSSPSDPAAIITLVCLAAYIASFAATWGPVVWVMLPEIFPLKVRGTAMATGTVLLWGANYVVSQTFPVLLDSFGPGVVFLGYAAIGVAAFLFTSWIVPETKGRSLEEIEADLRGKAIA